MIARVRTTLVALLVGVIAVRWSLPHPASTVAQRIAADPGEAIRSAADGWTYAGTLGGATAQGIRELPFAGFMLLGTELGLSAQAVEACWRVLVLVLAVVGAVRLARGLAGAERRGSEEREPWTPWVAAVLFALGAVLVPTLVRSPTDGLAAATLPWVVAPLLLHGLGWRPALASAAWLGLAGFGSPGWAVAALGAGIVAALTRGRADLLLFLRWLLLAGAASAWWIALRVWEGRHVVDVSALVDHDLRETAASAVGRVDPSWVLLLAVTGGPVVVAVGALCLRGVARLERRFVAVLLGLSVVVAAVVWVADWHPPLAAPLGGEAPASPVGPLLAWLGLCGLVAWCPLVDHLRDRVGAWGLRELPALGVALLVAVTAFAGLAAAAAEPERVPADESLLLDAVASWSAEAPPGRVLVLPADTGGTDLAALGAALGARPWVGRDAVPTSGAGGTVALDDLLTRLSRGDGGPGTAGALRRLGISYVLVRLGGPVQEDRAHPSGLVRAALSAAGARRLEAIRGTDPPGSDALMDFGVRSSPAQVEVWEVPGAGSAWVYDGEPVDVVGDAGTVTDLGDAGVLGDRAIRIRTGSVEEPVVLSDSARRRDVDQRLPLDPYGPDLGDDDPRTLLPPDAAPVVSATQRLEGVVALDASSSAADVDGELREVGTDPTAAVDANPFTSWQSRRGAGVGEWWEVVLDRPVTLRSASIQFAQNVLSDHAVSRVRVTADDKSASYGVGADGSLRLDDLGLTTRVRVTVTAVAGAVGPDDSVGIAEMTIPGVTVTERLVLTPTPATSWLFSARLGSRVQCVPVVPRGPEVGPPPGTACSDALGVGGPDSGTLDRSITVDRPTTVVGRAWLAAAVSEEAGALADRIAEPSVVASSESVATRDLADRPQAAADGDLRTAWRATPGERDPELTLAWTDPTDIEGIRLVPPAGDIGSRPTRVLVTAGGTDLRTEFDVAEDGTIRLPRVRTRSLTIALLDDTGVPTVDSATGNVQRMPVAVGEVELLGGPAVSYDRDRVEQLACSDGPAVAIGGTTYGTTLDVTPAQILSGELVRASLCGPVTLAPGEVAVTVPATFAWQPRGLLLTAGELGATDAGPASAGTDVVGRTAHGDPVSLGLVPAASVRTLVLGLPADAGWLASADGEPLEGVTVDGWSQGWMVPAGTGPVTLRYEPGVDVGRLALVASAGWFTVVLLLAVAAIRLRRSISP